MKIGANQFPVIAIGIALFLGAIRGSAQQPDDSSPRAGEVATAEGDGTSYMLSGTVVNSVTGEPIRRAAVQVSGQSGRVALTDHGGHFVLEGLAEGGVLLTAMKPGFADSDSNTPAQVGKDAPPVVLKLTPCAEIRGRVTTKDELPLEGLQVRLIARQNVEGRMVWADQPFRVNTDDEGEFRIPGLQAGSYYVAVDQGAETMPSQKGIANPREQVSTRVFYPGVSDVSAASAIELAAGDEAEADFTLSAEPVYHITGTLSGAARTVSNLTFKRKAGEDSDFSQSVSVQDGKFEVKIPAGSYSVSAQTGDGTELTTAGPSVLVRADEADLQVSLTAPVTIPVELEEEGSMGAQRRIAIHEGLPGVPLQLDPVSQFFAGVNPWRPQAGGIPNVAPGTYRLLVTTTGEWWIRSAQSGGVDLLSDDLTVIEGEQPEPIEIEVRDGAGTVSGTVMPQGDPGHVLVLLVQQHRSRNFVRATIASQGNFTISGVPPGDYTILALNDGDRLEYANPDVLNPYLSDAEQISVRARSSSTVNLGLTAVEK